MKNRIKKWIFRKWQMDFIRWIKPEYKERYLSLEEYNDVADTILFARHYFDRTYSTEQMIFLLNMQLGLKQTTKAHLYTCGRQDGKTTILMDYLCSKQDKLLDTHFMVVGSYGSRHLKELWHQVNTRLEIIEEKKDIDYKQKSTKTKDHINFQSSNNHISFINGFNFEIAVRGTNPNYLLIDECTDEIYEMALQYFPNSTIIAIRTDLENERLPTHRPHWYIKENWDRYVKIWNRNSKKSN